jgi:hypothetical protein
VRRTVLLVLAGLLAFAASLVLTVPAALLYDHFETEDWPVALYGLSGTAVDGRADLAQWQERRVERLRWDLRPAALLAGELRFALGFENPDAEGRGNLGRTLGGALRASGWEAQVPGGALEALWSTPPTRLGGQLHLRLDELTLADGRIAALSGTLDWRGARAGDPALVLGDFRLTLGPDKDGYRGELSDQGGPLRAEGLLTLTPDGAYAFKGSLAVRDPSRDDLTTILRLLGRPGPDGGVPLEFDGQIPIPGA